MKTTLPHKVSGADTVGLGYWSSEVNEMNITELQRSFNQLIDYIAELTEEVNGKIDAPKFVRYTHQVTVPTLKEQLLGEIKENSFKCGYSSYVSYDVVEAIINRLIK